ncbi:UNKNOWN [Stylonychia lemnae]|uniref:Uncharacterized protein n=1 Tax=Stylonychia lemnae TaxID=5949 RepID=A0A077ZVG6_STYLE|nr:UNKNOWN [Stylonychia lemnae]|eukprot:CDW73849.1 UNKNOWN [Stylonychia lemnae]
MANLDNYVNVTFQQVQFGLNNAGSYQNTEIKLLEVGEEFQAETIRIPQFYKCPVNFTASLQGSQTTKTLQSFRIIVTKCNQIYLSLKNESAKCMNDSMMQNFFDKLQFNVVATNQFIDVNEKSLSPIKTELKNFYATGYHNMSLNYQLKIGKNFLISSSSSLSNQLNQKNETYYTVREESLKISSQRVYQNQVFLNFNMMIDDNAMTTNLELYTVSDALSNTGGIIGIATIIIQFLVYKTQEYLYYQQLVKEIFKIGIEDSMPQNGKSDKLQKFPSQQMQNIENYQDEFSRNYKRILNNIKN